MYMLDGLDEPAGVCLEYYTWHSSESCKADLLEQSDPNFIKIKNKKIPLPPSRFSSRREVLLSFPKEHTILPTLTLKYAQPHKKNREKDR